MFPGGELVAGAASLVGGWLGNRAARQEAQRAREFAAEQSSTQWQRAVKDLQAAGLNPALAYSQGPNVAAGGPMAAQHDIVSPAVSSAMAAGRLRQELAVMRETGRKLSSEADTAAAIADREEATNKVLGMTRRPDGMLAFDLEKGPLKRRIDAEVRQAELNAEMLGLELPYMRANAKAAEAMPWTAYIDRLMKSVGAPLVSGVGGAAVGQLLRKPTVVQKVYPSRRR